MDRAGNSLMAAVALGSIGKVKQLVQFDFMYSTTKLGSEEQKASCGFPPSPHQLSSYRFAEKSAEPRKFSTDVESEGQGSAKNDIYAYLRQQTGDGNGGETHCCCLLLRER